MNSNSNTCLVTILIGAPGTNGVKLARRLYQDDPATTVKAIVPWPSKKGSSNQGNLTMVSTSERLKRLGSGCSCCTVRGDVLGKVRRIVDSSEADRVLIQASPQSDLDALAKTFSVADQNGAVLGDVAFIDQVVTVVDGSSLLKTLKSNSLHRLIEVVRTADSVWVDGAAGLEPQVRVDVLQALKTMNPEAHILLGDDGQIRLSQFARDAESVVPSLERPVEPSKPEGAILLG